jgi:hypothetical protein
MHPILDEYYTLNPSNERSASFAASKGQTVTNSKKEVIVDETDSSTESVDLKLPYVLHLISNITNSFRVHSKPLLKS